ncbi:unnamed protein product [Chrysodeixis includens]|uniref:Uncharacterized protein n=1 Tax=Chrysodeixis includens TaxID=689277 RepID=A0A9N8L6T8_CHRIL|nr:unnamed protein product [Chrysodeixis includens]
MNINDSTTCEEFAKYARFNPYSVLHQRWFVFYYWGPPKTVETIVFTFPTANHTKHLHKILDGNTILPIDWKARHILMENHKEEITLLVERGDRGQYWGFLLQKVLKGQKIRPRDLRIKQTGDTKIIGLMDCDRHTVLALCKIQEVPPKNRLQDEAARLGYRARRGKSYLYEGHEWMPIPEGDEKQYWAPKPKGRRSSQESSIEVTSTSHEKVESKGLAEALNTAKEQKEEAEQSSLEQVDSKETGRQTSYNRTINTQTSSNHTNNNLTSRSQTNINQTTSNQMINTQTNSDLKNSSDKNNYLISSNLTSNNQTNNDLKANDENNNTIMEESEESNEFTIDATTDEPDYSLTLDEKININKRLKKIQENNDMQAYPPIIEPEAETENEELQLLTTTEPYTSQSSKRKAVEGEEYCKNCFTLTAKERDLNIPNPETTNQPNSLEDLYKPQAMKTVLDSNDKIDINSEKFNDDSSVDNNEV